jgi:NodT family efflux transporter outer membrane factor (OMF) lipoprotein
MIWKSGKCEPAGNVVKRERTGARLVGAAVLLASCSVCGCSSLGISEGISNYVHNGFKVGPNYEPPPAPVANDWIEANDPRVQSSPPRDANWWDVFQDPVLSSLIAQAYQQNPNLRSVGMRVLQARAQRGMAVGNLFPQTQNIQSTNDITNAFGTPVNLDLTTFNLSWEIDFWGRYRRQVESANATVEASVASYDDALVTLLADVATYYVQFRVAQLRIKIARENLKTQERLLSLSEEQQKVGTATALDVAQIRTLYEQTRASIPAYQSLQGQANDRLCTLLGQPPHDLEPQLGPGPELGGPLLPRVPNSVAAGIPAELLSRRPDVRSAERQIAAQNAQIGVAKAEYLPHLSVGTMFGYADLTGLPRFPLFSTQGFLIAFTPQFTWNVLNYGRILNNVRVQESHTDELVYTYQNTVLNAAQEVQTAIRGFLLTQDQAEHLARSASAASSATQIEEKLFTAIKADVNRLFTLESSQLSAQDAFAQAQGNIALNLINAYRALGGGWQIRLQDPDNCVNQQVNWKRAGNDPTPNAAVMPVNPPTPGPAAATPLAQPRSLPPNP